MARSVLPLCFALAIGTAMALESKPLLKLNRVTAESSLEKSQVEAKLAMLEKQRRVALNKSNKLKAEAEALEGKLAFMNIHSLEAEPAPSVQEKAKEAKDETTSTGSKTDQQKADEEAAHHEELMAKARAEARAVVASQKEEHSPATTSTGSKTDQEKTDEESAHHEELMEKAWGEAKEVVASQKEEHSLARNRAAAEGHVEMSGGYDQFEAELARRAKAAEDKLMAKKKAEAKARQHSNTHPHFRVQEDLIDPVGNAQLPLMHQAQGLANMKANQAKNAILQPAAKAATAAKTYAEKVAYPIASHAYGKWLGYGM